MAPFLTRRSFLTAITATAVSMAARAAPAAAAPYRIGVETYCFHDVDLTATLAHTKSVGLRYLELHDGHLPYAAPHAAGANMVVGKGTIDMAGVFAALADMGFDGLLVLEYEGDFDNMPKRLEGMRQSLAAMDRFVAAATKGVDLNISRGLSISMPFARPWINRPRPCGAKEGT